MVKNIRAIILSIQKAVGHLRVEWHQGLSVFQLLIGTVLSARTRDENTDKAVKSLFAKYETPRKLASASLSEIRKLIKPTNFYKSKAIRIKRLSKILLQKYDGKVPRSREELIKLPGVGPKVSAIVMAYGFKSNIAIPVDVHVHRVSNRIGIVKTKAPEKTELALMKKIPKKYWLDLNELFVLFGQNICKPRVPLCSKCPITRYCHYYATSCLKRGLCK
ncbi:MAG: endonuclease III [Candidatus Nanoarchaeia archaeon]